MYGVPRTATVTARSDLQLYVLGREDFLLALTGHSELHGAAHELAQERLAELQALSKPVADDQPAPLGR
jgi:CRP-like cAMP-binding protein